MSITDDLTKGQGASNGPLEVLKEQYGGMYQQATKTAAGATNSIYTGRLADITVQIDASVSANNAQVQGSIDNTNWANAIGSALVSGTTVTIKNISASYRYIRGNVDAYSSGTVTFDFWGRGV